MSVLDKIASKAEQMGRDYLSRLGGEYKSDWQSLRHPMEKRPLPNQPYGAPVRGVLGKIPMYEGSVLPAPEIEGLELMEETPTMLNASGESEASLEAIKRGASEARQGVKRFAVDSRSGARRPILGSDVNANPFEHIIRSSPEGDFIESSGAKARPLPSGSIH